MLVCENAGVLQDLIVTDLMFKEHRINGKSQGNLFLPFKSLEAAGRAKHLFDRMYVLCSLDCIRECAHRFLSVLKCEFILFYLNLLILQ